MPIEGIAFAIGSFILGKAAEKTVTAGLEGGAKGLASGITDWREKRRFDELLARTWTDFRKDSDVDFRIAQALEKILWHESEGAEQFRFEAAKLLAPGTEPDITALASLYNERLKWARFWGKEAAPPWEDLATPLTRFFELLRDRLLQDKLLGPLMVERSEQDWLQTSAEALEELRRFWEQAVTPSGALRVQAEPREFTDEEWAAAEQRYRELALASCDIIDLANLPEDRHLATRYLELRRLYVPLRVQVEIPLSGEVEDAALEALEKRRAALRWGHEARKDRRIQQPRVPSGERLAAVRRLVVLGDPGAGKSTLVRWIATAYLLRLNRDPDWRALPDVATLPNEAWLPILIRCRDLTQECLDGALDDMLCHTLRKAQMTESESECFRAFLPQKLLRGEAILLIDGLDEIQDPGSRARFCEQIEAMHVAFPDAPIIVTSRIVGYREMRYRIGRGFEHVTIADLAPEEKDTFIDRWCALTERPERREEAAGELKHDVHSADRIERLTGNPMLLTTMALVKRKVGKLPSRRGKLYWEAVNVLLNWRSAVDPPVDDREALPQLEYVAYVMCQRGVQQLREDEVLELLEAMRTEYPNVRPAHAHSPEEFLHLLERRTGLLVEAGNIQHLGRPAPVYEFRHLTFQEYLAGLALVDGKYAGRDRTRSLAQHVANLAGQTGAVKAPDGQEERVVVENWREPLRLCVASAGDDDVEEVLLAILRPLPDEESETTARPRAVLAALCLADEPNVSDATVGTILTAFAKQADERDGTDLSVARTSLDVAALEVAGSCWAPTLEAVLVDEFRAITGQTREAVGRACGLVATAVIGEGVSAIEAWLRARLIDLKDGGTQAILSALSIAAFFSKKEAPRVEGLVEQLVAMLDGEVPAAYASALALAELEDPRAVEPLLARLDDPDTDMRRAAVEALRRLQDARAVEPLLAKLDDPDSGVQSAAALSVGWLEDPRAVEPLLARLDDPDADMRRAAVEALRWLQDARAVEPLLAKLDDSDSEVRCASAQTLGELGDLRAVEPLLARLDDLDAGMRRAAAQALGELGDLGAVEPLLARLDDRDAGVRMGAIFGLGQLGDARALEPLLANLEDLDPRMRGAAAEALGLLEDPKALQPLIARLDDPDAMVRWEAAFGLGQLKDPRAVQPLLMKLDDSDPKVQRAAAQALGWLGDPGAAELLIARLDHSDAIVRWGAAYGLGQLKDPRAFQPLLMRLDDSESRIRWAAADALGRIGDTRAAEVLFTHLDDPYQSVQITAAEALGRLKDPRGMDRLLSWLGDADAALRRAAAEALGEVGDMQAVEPLLARLEDPDAGPRRAAAEALGKIGDLRAVEPLLVRLEDPDAGLRQAALGALSHQCPDHLDRKLLSRDLDACYPFLDPRVTIAEEWICRAAVKLGIPLEEVRQRYEAMAQQFKLKLEWEAAAPSPSIMDGQSLVD